MQCGWCSLGRKRERERERRKACADDLEKEEERRAREEKEGKPLLKPKGLGERRGEGLPERRRESTVTAGCAT